MQSLYIDMSFFESAALSLGTGRMILNKRIELDAIPSITTSFSATQNCKQKFAWSTQQRARSVGITYDAALSASHWFADDHHFVVEPACGAALAVHYYDQDALELQEFEKIAVVICGGGTATLDWLRARS